VVKEFVLITPEGKGILGQLDGAGVVTFAVEAGEGSSVRGTELFNRMMAHFGGEVAAIRGVWRKGPLGRPSANIDKVNELTGAGMTLEEAVSHAWTVTRAAKWGFTRVKVSDAPAGRPGAYTAVDVLMERSEIETG